MYQVIVGNIDTVYEGNDKWLARATFQIYYLDYKYNHGESVTLLEDGEVIKEYAGEQNEQD